MIKRSLHTAPHSASAMDAVDFESTYCFQCYLIPLFWVLLFIYALAVIVMNAYYLWAKEVGDERGSDMEDMDMLEIFCRDIRRRTRDTAKAVTKYGRRR